MMNKKAQAEVFIVLVIVVIICTTIAFLMFGYPMLKPWWSEQQGKAELRQAEQNRQIAVLEAQAKKESAIQLAQAEVERAKGVAEANKIIAQSLDEQYLRYLWIQGLNDGTSEVVYVPTEANLPILEARDR